MIEYLLEMNAVGVMTEEMWRDPTTEIVMIQGMLEIEDTVKEEVDRMLVRPGREGTSDLTEIKMLLGETTEVCLFAW